MRAGISKTLVMLGLLGTALGAGCASIVGADFDRPGTGTRTSADGGFTISADGDVVALPIATEDFVTAYAHALCDDLARCCADNAIGFDLNACLAVAIGRAQSSYVNPGKSAGLTYDPAAAGECVARTRKATQACAWTTEDARIGNYSCSKVYVGTKKPGEACEEQNDCASSPEGIVTCTPWSIPTGDGGRVEGQQCTLLRRAASRGDSCDYSGPDHPSALADCFTPEGDALLCDATTKTCQPPAPIGATCSYGSYCTDDAYCTATSSSAPGLCARKLGVGQACADNTQCEPQLWCDTSEVCAARKPPGAACEYSAECASRYCSKSKCLSNAVGLPDRCGGASTGG